MSRKAGFVKSRVGVRAAISIAAVVVVMLLAMPAGATCSPHVSFVAVGNGPGQALYDQRNGEVFVLNLLDNTASILNGATNSVLQTVPAGNGPDVAAFDLANGDIYVTDANTNQVAVLNGGTGATVATVSTAPSILPQGITYDNQNGYLYVANSGTYPNPTYQNSNTVSVIDGRTNSLVATIPDTFAPLATSFLISDVYDPQTGYVYISDEGYGIQVLDPATNTFVANIVTSSNYAVAYDPVNGVVYAFGYSAGPGLPSTIGVINTPTNTIVQTIPLPSSCLQPGSGTVDLRNGLVYIACLGNPNTVAVFDPYSSAIVQDFSVGGSAFFTVVGAFDLRTGAIYIPVPTTASVAVVYPGAG